MLAEAQEQGDIWYPRLTEDLRLRTLTTSEVMDLLHRQQSPTVQEAGVEAQRLKLLPDISASYSTVPF